MGAGISGSKVSYKKSPEENNAYVSSLYVNMPFDRVGYIAKLPPFFNILNLMVHMEANMYVVNMCMTVTVYVVVNFCMVVTVYVVVHMCGSHSVCGGQLVYVSHSVYGGHLVW